MKCRRRLHDERTAGIQEGNVDSRKALRRVSCARRRAFAAAQMQLFSRMRTTALFGFSRVRSRSDQQPQPFPFPPQQNRSRRISRQLSFPQLLNMEFPFPQKQFSRSRIQITLHPQELPLNRPLFPESHPHPQFVAAKSLISFPPN